VLRPRYAVLWAAFFNFVAMFIFAPRVADTVSKIVDVQAADASYVWVVLAGLIGAIVWDLLTWWWGLPTSSSHALIGGFAGAGVAHGGFDVLNWDKILLTVGFIPLAPLIGMVAGVILMIAVAWLFQKWSPSSVDTLFRKGQLVSAALYSLGHGGNDAQKTMGIIVGLLVASQATFADFPVRAFHLTTAEVIPTWVILSAHFAIAMGTFLGGWRIVHTMGSRITRLKPVHGFCAETGGAISVFLASALGIPVSTTHVITGSIMGVGAARRLSAVRWGLAGRIIWAWVLTIPLSAGLGGIFYFALRALF
jgi:PiT family inorganic phosphate transporter